MALDRFLTIKFRQWGSGFFKGRNVVIYLFLVCLLLLGLNGYFLAVNGYIDTRNDTNVLNCGPVPYDDWSISDIFAEVYIFCLVFRVFSEFYKIHLNTHNSTLSRSYQLKQIFTDYISSKIKKTVTGYFTSFFVMLFTINFIFSF